MLKALFELCLQGCRFHANHVFLFNTFNCDPHFDALTLGFCYIFLIIGQTLGEGTKDFKCVR